MNDAANIAPRKISFLGLGVMGAPMAGHLANAGHDVCVYNRTTTRAQNWVESYGGSLGETPAASVQGAEIVMACVGNDDDLRAVCMGPDGAFDAMAEGSLFIDHTTVSPAVTQELAALAAERGINYVDAPVSGGQPGAEKGVLSIMCGGADDAFAQAETVMGCYGRTIRHLGAVSMGQAAKMCNQVAIAGVMQGLSEALLMADAAGLDGEALVEVISGGAAGSWQMVNRHKTMLADHYDHGFAVDWMRKDLGIVLEAADSFGVELPVATLVNGFYGEVQEMGGGRWDTSSLFRRLQKAQAKKS